MSLINDALKRAKQAQQQGKTSPPFSRKYGSSIPAFSLRIS